MVERPIIFSGPMVKALLDGRKTQTRRVLKPQPVPSDFRNTTPDSAKWFHDPVRGGMWIADGVAVGPFRSPAPGDRLWVRETWRIGAWDHETGKMCVDFRADGLAEPTWRDVPDPDWFENQWIRISDELRRKGIEPGPDGHYAWPRGEAPLSWRPPIHMPRWASRLRLTVTDVRVQRLQEISEEDAVAEGCPCREGEDGLDPRGWFRDLWDSLNGSDAWDANPWVMALTFTVEHADPAAREGQP